MAILPCRWSLRHFVVSCTVLGVLLSSFGCGTLLHPERWGQSRGQIDPAIAILDGVGLLFFFVPGAIAFAVDFATGAIYLPDGYSHTGPHNFNPAECEVIHVPPEELTAGKLETVLSEKTGQDVKLTPGSYQVSRLDPATNDFVPAGTP